jgi:phosphoglycolate phosphatase
MKKIDLMIFDLDGTLVSSGTDLVAAVNYTLNELELPKRPEKEIIGFVGDGVRSLIERSLGDRQEKLADNALKIFTDYYSEHLLDNTKLYPDVLDVLTNFADKIKIILTNKRYEFTLKIARALNLENHFHEIIGADTLPYQKPDGRLIDYLLHKYEAKKDKTIMIGDGINDVYVAKNAGILSVAYLNGLGLKDDLLAARADYYCENLLELNSLFL